jgi:hypothetical protein
MYSVVGARTICKNDFVVSSISSFVAPRGSTSSNLFKMLSVTIAVSGFLGVFRWHMVGAHVVVTNLGLVGFACLLLVALFDFDVLPQRFLEGKLRSTKWLMDKLLKKKGLSRPFPFHKANILKFVRTSPLIYHLFDEDHHTVLQLDTPSASPRNPAGRSGNSNSDLVRRGGGRSGSKNREEKGRRSRSRSKSRSRSHDKVMQIDSDKKTEERILAKAGLVPDIKTSISGLLHMVGAIGFVFCTTTAVLMQEPSETLIIGPVTGCSFLLFSFMGYLTGNYVPLFHCMRGWVLPWNPFVSDPYFMLKLQVSLDALLDGGEDAWRNSRHGHQPGRRSDPHQTAAVAKMDIAIDVEEARQADLALDNPLLRYARTHPMSYLHMVGHMMVISEMIALLTPCVAVGIQWICALCNDSARTVLIDLINLGSRCVMTVGAECFFEPHCAIRGK